MNAWRTTSTVAGLGLAALTRRSSSRWPPAPVAPTSRRRRAWSRCPRPRWPGPRAVLQRAAMADHGLVLDPARRTGARSSASPAAADRGWRRRPAKLCDRRQADGHELDRLARAGVPVAGLVGAVEAVGDRRCPALQVVDLGRLQRQGQAVLLADVAQVGGDLEAQVVAGHAVDLHQAGDRRAQRVDRAATGRRRRSRAGGRTSAPRRGGCRRAASPRPRRRPAAPAPAPARSRARRPARWRAGRRRRRRRRARSPAGRGRARP